MMEDNQAQQFPLKSRSSLEMRIARAILATQSVTMGLGGTGTLLLGVIAALSGNFLLACIVLGIAAFACCVAIALWCLKPKLQLIFNTSGVYVLLIEIVLIVIGVGQLALENALPAVQQQGTDGPFADGGSGFIALSGLIYAIGGLIVIVLFIWTFVWKTFHTGTSQEIRDM